MTYHLTLTLITGETRIFLGVTENQKWDLVQGMRNGGGTAELTSTTAGRTCVIHVRNILIAEFLEGK